MFHSYAAIGDSFTEGVGDELPDGTVRGWADFVALGLALPMGAIAGILLTGLVLLAIAGLMGLRANQKLPRRPLANTQARLRTDLTEARELLT